MKTDTQAKILTFIDKSGQARVSELQKFLNISSVAVHKQLNRLLEKGLVKRVGTPPFVFYILPEREGDQTVALYTDLTKANIEVSIPSNTLSLIENTFLYIIPDGSKLNGLQGFLYWVAKFKKGDEVLAHAQEYNRIWGEKERDRTANGWFDITTNLHAAFPETFIDHFLFKEVYSIRTFGKTKLGNLVRYAKDMSNRELIDQVSMEAKPLVEKVIEMYSIEAVSYIPPTIERPVQFMKELEIQLNISLPQIQLIKTKPPAGVIQQSQKSITDPVERVLNARNTIFLKNTMEKQYKNVLLIDDASGSGASFNETARKLKNKGIGSNCIVSFSLVGNLNLKQYPVLQRI